MTENNKTSIKNWAEDDKPREKLVLKGRASLSDAELIAILIGSGNNEESAVALARRILQGNNGNLVDLSRTSVNDLMKYKGIGQAKAISIVAALELGKRRRSAEARKQKVIQSSKDAYEQIYVEAADLHYEKFWAILLNQANKVIRIVEVSEGGVAGTVADPKKIFKIALENNASFLILCHNHPSGQLKASDADIQLTRKLCKAGELLDLKIIDHLIVGTNEYFSFADNGMI